MSKFFLFSVIVLLAGCGHDRFKRKVISGKDCEISWFYYSYISNRSPDIVTIKSKDEELEIYRAAGVISDVYLSGDTALVIKTFRPSRGIVYTKNPRSEVLRYKIIIDTTASSDESEHIPIGRK